MSPQARRRSALMPARDMTSKRETRAEDTPSTIVAARCQSAREGRSVRSCRNAACPSSFENDLTGAMVCQSSFRRKMPLVLPYRAMFFNIHSCSVGYIASDKAESIENLIGMPWTRRFRARTPHAQLCSVWKRGSPEPCGMCTRRRPGGAPAADLGARQDQRLAARHRPPCERPAPSSEDAGRSRSSFETLMPCCASGRNRRSTRASAGILPSRARRRRRPGPTCACPRGSPGRPRSAHG